MTAVIVSSNPCCAPVRNGRAILESKCHGRIKRCGLMLSHSAMPPVKVTPSMTIVNWFAPFRRRSGRIRSVPQEAVAAAVRAVRGGTTAVPRDRPDQCDEGADRGHVERSGNAASVADDAGRGSDHRTCGLDFRAADGAVPSRTRFRHLAWPRTLPTFHGRQAEAGEDLEDGGSAISCGCWSSARPP